MTVVSSIGLDEEVHRHPSSDKDNEPPNPRLRQLLRIVGAEISAHQGACDHDYAVRPVDGALENEYQYGDAVDGHPQDALQGVHGVNVGHADRGQHGQVDNAHAASEIAAVHRHHQLENRL